ncbi:GGDEF domain-containing protein [Butyrivibrio proteoclasticus]|uniref:GGDEF domain-containing protein n=1 Tax=Butyrivibrio proteoclasticus TaxID=43305 RepID=UPI00047CAC1F|nr:GGDEF domain-containing protein [Butyrivibrio proteoclasticus]
MEQYKYRIGFLIIIITTLLAVILTAFLGSADISSAYNEQYINIDKGWDINGVKEDLPCAARGYVVMERTLPYLYRDQVLVVQCFYKTADVYIGNQLVYSSNPNYFLGRETNVGHNELYIPLKKIYSGKTVKLVIDVQDSVYTRRISDAFVFSSSGYITHIILKNLFSLTLVTTFFISGIAEVGAAIYYITQGKRVRARYSFFTLLYTGVFSTVASMWIVCETMVMQALYGHPTAFAIINDVLFMFMPLTFLELLRSLTNRHDKREDALVFIMGVVAVISIILCMLGVFDWNLTEYVGHFMVFTVFIHVICIVIITMRSDVDRTVKSAVAIGNTIFVVFSAIGLLGYMLGISQNYLAFVIAGFMSYALVQVFIIFQQIGISIEEEEEFATVTEYAYQDELTGLNNRRYFYTKVEYYNDKEKRSPNLTLINIDANRLKYYNDTYGHDAGDELLVGAARCIQKAFGSCNEATICRMGGDEFAILITEDRETVESKVKELRKLLSEYKGRKVSNLSVALGVAQVGDHPDISTFDELYKIADDHMYEDKQRYYKESGIDRRRG